MLTAYPSLERLIPAMGYGEAQMRELEATLNAVDADLIVAGTPIDLTRVLTLNKAVVRVRYDLEEVTGPPLATLIAPILARAERHDPVHA